MSTAFKKLRQLLILLLACSSPALRAQDVTDMAAQLKKERDETQRLAASTEAKDRLSAIDHLAFLEMDYSLLWKLMNDPDSDVRAKAISFLDVRSCTTQEREPLSADLAQTMATMLEQEVTQERIRTAFAPPNVKDDPSNLAFPSALALDYLYRYHSLKQSPAHYSAWQRRVLRPLFLAATGSGTFSANRHACALNLLSTLSDTALLAEALLVILQKLDDSALPAPLLLRTLESLWSHPLLGHGQPLNLLLLVQLAPRLEALRPRILAPMPEGQDKVQAARLIKEIAEVIQTVGKKMPVLPQQPQAAPYPTQAPAPVDAEENLKSPPMLPPLSPQEEQKRHAEIQRLAVSSVAQDRISAAEEMVSSGIVTDHFQKLLHDPENEVSVTAMDMLVAECHQKPSHIPQEEARKMAALLEPEVTKERITTLYEGEGAQREHRIHMTCYAALALNQLYRLHALLPNPASYGHWQEEVLRSLVIYVAGDYRDPGGEHDELVIEVLRAISDPYTLCHTVELLGEYPNLDNITAARQLFYLEELWTHPLLGEGKPMNLILLQTLAPVWEPVRDHILRNIRDKDQPSQTAVGLLGRMDAAYREAGKRLSLLPAVK
jgi:hypothetical protein